MSSATESPSTQGTPKRVVLVDDDELFRESLERNLRDSGFEVISFDRGEPALHYFTDGGQAEILLLDWKMPEISGIEVLKRLREDKPEIPVIFLTVLSDQIYEEAALLSGAVDFVEKSRSFAILARRMELILQGAKRGTPTTRSARPSALARIGPLELREDASRALWNDQQVPLTLTEFKIVHYLASRTGQDVRYRELYDLVRGKGFTAGYGAEGYRANVRTLVKRIRQKFRNIDDSFNHIENYPGFGYRWKED